MCGRYVMNRLTGDVVALFGVERVLCEIYPTWNVAPTHQVPILLRPEGELLLSCFRWGLIPSWAQNPSVGHKLINARAETIAQKPSFRDAFYRRRCLVIADGFFEWEKEGDRRWPKYIQLESEETFAMAGIWERWCQKGGPQLDTFSIITTEANEKLAHLHHRMPVILPKEDHEPWLDPQFQNTEALRGLLRPYSGQRMKFHDVAPRVNSIRYNAPDCIAPVVVEKAAPLPVQASLFDDLG